MADDTEIVYLNVSEGAISEVRLSLVLEVARMIDRHCPSIELDEWIKENDANVTLPIETANALKKFIFDCEIHKKERLGKIVPCLSG